ncbi:MAG: FAD binding domain-containing protein, partial [Acidimicrobiia bacterium]|nr:FAD binding domain-containing protein [Acidimicrobiia bacterium]
VDVEEHAAVDRVPGLGEALRQIGHVQIRSRTTIGGSIAHADPAAELPALLVALDGEIVLQSAARGERVVGAGDFFVGPLMTARRADELVTSVFFPAHAGSVAVVEVAKRPGDFALVGAVVGHAIVDGVVSDPRVAVFGMAGRAVRVASAEAALVGSTPGPEAFAAAAERLRDEIEPWADAHASSDYRRHVAATLVERALVSLS